jgi:hypothetical protein
MILATMSLIVALTSSGYSFAHNVSDLGRISVLEGDALERISALDSVFWAPGLYVICWLALLDERMRQSNVAMVAVLAPLLAFDAIDDVSTIAFKGNGPRPVVLAELVINVMLLVAAWRFVRRWPFRLTVPQARSAPVWFYRIPGLKAYFLWSLQSWLLPVVLGFLALLPKVYSFVWTQQLPLGDAISFAGMSLVLLHLLLVSNVSWVAGDMPQRNRIYWSLLAFLFFGVYSFASATLELLRDFVADPKSLNVLYFSQEWVFYFLTLASLFMGTVFSNLVSSAPLFRSAVVLSAFVVVVSAALFLAGHYGIEFLGRELNVGFYLGGLIAAVLGYFMERIFSTVLRMLRWIVPNT